MTLNPYAKTPMHKPSAMRLCLKLILVFLLSSLVPIISILEGTFYSYFENNIFEIFYKKYSFYFFYTFILYFILYNICASIQNGISFRNISISGKGLPQILFIGVIVILALILEVASNFNQNIINPTNNNISIWVTMGNVSIFGYVFSYAFLIYMIVDYLFAYFAFSIIISLVRYSLFINKNIQYFDCSTEKYKLHGMYLFGDYILFSLCFCTFSLCLYIATVIWDTKSGNALGEPIVALIILIVWFILSIIILSPIYTINVFLKQKYSQYDSSYSKYHFFNLNLKNIFLIATSGVLPFVIKML